MNIITLNEYQKESKKTWKQNYRNDFYRAILGLVGESGEIADKIKKSMRDDTYISSTDMGKELGDCLYYIARLAEYYNLTLEQVAQMNIEKLQDRQKRGKIHGEGDNR